LENQNASFHDRNIGGGPVLVAEAGGGKGVAKAGVSKEEEKLPSRRVLRRTSKKRASTGAPVVDNDYITPEYKSASHSN
jgi:hypothetical protein